jgi:hypothetical protein
MDSVAGSKTSAIPGIAEIVSSRSPYRCPVLHEAGEALESQEAYMQLEAIELVSDVLYMYWNRNTRIVALPVSKVRRE